MLEELVLRFPKKIYWVQLSLIYGALEKYPASLAVQQAIEALAKIKIQHQALKAQTVSLKAIRPTRDIKRKLQARDKKISLLNLHPSDDVTLVKSQHRLALGKE